MAPEFFDKVLEFFRRNIGIFQEKIEKKLAKKDKPVWIQLNAKCRRHREIEKCGLNPYTTT